MIGAGLGAGDAPPVNLARTWPSAAATDGIHTQAAAATAAFQTRIGETAAASHDAANVYPNHEATLEAGEFKDLIGAITSPISNLAGVISGSIGSLNSVTGVLGSVSSAAASTSSSLVNNLTGTLSHTGSPTHTASMPEHTDTAPLSGPTNSPMLPGLISQPPKGFGTEVVNV